jgi:flavin reductase (DIM6/NTAB) family NADH-FMN oxidoreductase RutF
MQADLQNIFSLTNHEVYVLTACHGGRENGQIATWIMPATLATGYHRVVAVVSRANFTHGLLEASGKFALSLLAVEQKELLPHFGLFSGHDQDKMAGVALERTGAGLPVIKEAVGWVECKVMDAMEGGDRVIYLADVVDSQFTPERRPLCKADAFASLPDEVRQALVQKRVDEGKRDAGIIRQFIF